MNVTLGSQRLVAGQTLVVEATVANTGNAPGSKTIEFEVDDEELEARTLVIQPGERRTVAFTHRFETPGTHRVEVDTGQELVVEVVARTPNVTVTELTASPTRVAPGEAFTVTAVVENDGYGAGEQRVELVLFGEVVDAEVVSLEPGDSREVTFTRRIESPGTYTASVGNRSVEVAVAGGDSPTTTPEPTPTPGQPGFGAAAVLVAVAVLAARVAHRRR